MRPLQFFVSRSKSLPFSLFTSPTFIGGVFQALVTACFDAMATCQQLKAAVVGLVLRMAQCLQLASNRRVALAGSGRAFHSQLQVRSDHALPYRALGGIARHHDDLPAQDRAKYRNPIVGLPPGTFQPGWITPGRTSTPSGNQGNQRACGNQFKNETTLIVRQLEKAVGWSLIATLSYGLQTPDIEERSAEVAQICNCG